MAISAGSIFRTGFLAPISNISPTAKALLTYIPLPNVVANQATTMRTSRRPRHEPMAPTFESIRPSRSSSPPMRASAGRTSPRTAANPFLPNDVDSVHNRSLLVSHTYTITPKLLNEFRFGFTNVTTSVNFPIQGSDALTQLDLQA